MAAKIIYTERDGITVPYPPLFDHIRQNHGYFETRGKPENVDLIPEVQHSEALRQLLINVASPRSAISSLGCDIGEARFPTRRLSSRYEAGGYVQFCPNDVDEQGYLVLRPLAKIIEKILTEEAGVNNWRVELSLTPVALKFDSDLFLRSVWVWFHAISSTGKGALKSREKLISALHKAVTVFHDERSGLTL